MNIIRSLYYYIIDELSFIFSVPAIIWQILFFYIPLFFIICLSFIISIDSTFIITFAHYKTVWSWIHFKIIAQSVLLALTIAALCLMVGYPIAYYVGIKKRSLKNIFISFLILPFWTNLLVHVYAWFFVLERNGFLNNLLLSLGLIKEPLALLNSMFAVILVMFYCYLPFMILPIISSLEKFDVNLIEASLDLGASPSQTFFKIILPMSYAGVRTGFFLVFVPAFGEFIIPLLLGGDKNMYVGTLISHYFLIAQDLGTGTAFTVMSCIVLMIIVLFFNWLFKSPTSYRGK